MWGPGNEEKQRVVVTGVYPSEALVSWVHKVNIDNPITQSENKPYHKGIVQVAPGKAPAADKIAQVRPGEEITILWSLNNHGGRIQVQWEKNGPLPLNAPEPAYDHWTSPSQTIADLPYRDDQGEGVKCASFTYGQGALGSIMASQPLATWSGRNDGSPGGISENRACWGKIRIPVNMPSGYNRMLYQWISPPNDGRFYDAFWVNVVGGSGGAPSR